MSHATLSVLPLTEADHSNLRALAHARTAPRHHAERAGIVLQLATGWSVREAATRLGLNPQRSETLCQTSRSGRRRPRAG